MQDNLKYLGIQLIPILLNFILSEIIDNNLFIGFIIILVLSILNVIFSIIATEELIDNDNKWVINAFVPIGVYIISSIICMNSIFSDSSSSGFSLSGLCWLMLQPIVVISLIIGAIMVCKTENKYNKNDFNDNNEE